MGGQRKTAGLMPSIASLPLGEVTGYAFLRQRPQFPTGSLLLLHSHWFQPSLPLLAPPV